MQRFFLALMLVFGLQISQARSEIIVVAVTGTDNFVPGKELSLSEEINLPDGARVTLLSQSGKMQVLTGPINGLLPSKLEQAGVDNIIAQWAAVKKILGQPDARSEVFGASRTVDGKAPPSPGVWHVSVDSSGPRCTKSSKLTLWRRNADLAQSISIRSALGSLKNVAWDKNQDVLLLPINFPLEDGKMIVGIEGEIRELELYVAPISIEEESIGALLGWLIDKNCTRQASALIQLVHRDAVID